MLGGWPGSLIWWPACIHTSGWQWVWPKWAHQHNQRSCPGPWPWAALRGSLCVPRCHSSCLLTFSSGSGQPPSWAECQAAFMSVPPSVFFILPAFHGPLLFCHLGPLTLYPRLTSKPKLFFALKYMSSEVLCSTGSSLMLCPWGYSLF